MTNYPPEEQLPEEQPIRARVPEHVSDGAFSTGVIVMTAHNEFILDFVQNLQRPHQIVARVVMPHNVLPQLVDALHRNIELYRGRWGELPRDPTQQQPAPTPASAPSPASPTENSSDMRTALGASESTVQAEHGPSPTAQRQSGVAPGAEQQDAVSGASGGGSGESPQQPVENEPSTPPPPGTRQASAQEVYDDLKIRDEFLSGAYANAVMIGHGPHEFSFDFITNFYPHSAVSARVFLAAGQIPRLYDSLRGTWDQMQRMRPPPGPRPFPPQHGPGEPNPDRPEFPETDSDSDSDDRGPFA